MAPAVDLLPKRIVLADDRPRARRALRALLTAHAEIAVVAEAADGEAAVALVERLRPDVVILDVRMPRLDGISAATRIKASCPSVRIVVVSLALDYRDAALAAGAHAFVLKGSPAEELLSAVGALRGGAPASAGGH